MHEYKQTKVSFVQPGIKTHTNTTGQTNGSHGEGIRGGPCGFPYLVIPAGEKRAGIAS